jgi:hypothetical protein
MAGFIWYELMADEPEPALAFYRAVVGWKIEAFDPSDHSYTILKAAGRGIGGVLPTPADARAAGARPAWLGYIAVPDVDAAARSIVEAGGKLHRDIMDIPSVGRIAMVSDPQGAPFYLIDPDGEDRPPLSPMTAGTVGWRELHTIGWSAAFDFYRAQFGWQKAEAIEMGPAGTYQIFQMESGGNWSGGMFDSDGLGRPAWLFYFVVGDIDEAAARVRAAGGEVLEEPMQVPGGVWTIQCRDPQGAMFALVGSRRT